MANDSALAGHGSEHLQRDIITPEGVPVPVYLADRGARATAVLIDLIIIFALLVALSLIIALASGDAPLSGWVLAFILLVSFALRSFYFIFFELRWHGATPGKRLLKLRVIDRRGGRLAADAVFARNLMREVEIFLPFSLLVAGDYVGTERWMIVLTLVWVSIFVLMPFFNRDRLRVGDIVGGTWVIAASKGVLLPDLARTATASSPAGEADPVGVRFSKKQLRIYGIYELQTLETVLRQKGPEIDATRAAVCSRIQRKIGWDGEQTVDTREFLEAFYVALRAHLERKLLFGVRRKNKFDKR